LTVSLGRLYDDPPGIVSQLEICRRRDPVIRRHGIYPVQLQRCLWSHRVGLQRKLGRTPLTHRRGLFIYAALNLSIGIAVRISGGRLEPREYDLKEYWTWKGPGQQPWFVRAIDRRKARRESSQDTSQNKHGMNLGDEQSSFDHSRQNSSTEEAPPLLSPLPRAAAGNRHYRS
ncbi:hypothetical protein IMZ48_27420, partial [Candidatus Bathyarchaeota archaeon]|nr:hypothetical protein [Candidatus Bathyarchaeota archaeon]